MAYPQIVHPSWYPCPCWDHAEGIRKQLIPGTFTPVNPQDVFKAFRMPVADVRVVLISQDPYPQPQNACGIAYAIPDKEARSKFNQWPKSLQVIADAIREFCIDPEKVEHYFDPSMTFWEEQGVLLLNSALTTNIGVPGSHRDLWHPFMSAVVSWLQEIHTGLIWYFHGGIAKEFSRVVFDMAHHKFFSSHPAARERDFDSKFKDIQILYQRLYDADLHWVLPF